MIVNNTIPKTVTKEMILEDERRGLNKIEANDQRWCISSLY